MWPCNLEIITHFCRHPFSYEVCCSQSFEKRHQKISQRQCPFSWQEPTVSTLCWDIFLTTVTTLYSPPLTPPSKPSFCCFHIAELLCHHTKLTDKVTAYQGPLLRNIPHFSVTCHKPKSCTTAMKFGYFTHTFIYPGWIYWALIFFSISILHIWNYAYSFFEPFWYSRYLHGQTFRSCKTAMYDRNPHHHPQKYSMCYQTKQTKKTLLATVSSISD